MIRNNLIKFESIKKQLLAKEQYDKTIMLEKNIIMEINNVQSLLTNKTLELEKSIDQNNIMNPGKIFDLN